VDREHVLPSSTEALRPKHAGFFFRAAQLEKTGGADAPRNSKWRSILCQSWEKPERPSGTPTRMRLMARPHKGTARFNPWLTLCLKAFQIGLEAQSVITTLGRSGICHQTHAQIGRRSSRLFQHLRSSIPSEHYREIELAAFLSLDHGANLGAKGVESEGFRQHVHARLEKLAAKRCVLGVSGYEKYFYIGTCGARDFR
jgi:hypothetical protein